ncbi:MAG TPA: hypothetical protein VGJ29_03830 [Vicinamibacterales bacterium]|jgi:hypothetical protein
MTEVRDAAAPDQAPKDLIGFLDYYLVKKAPFQIPDNAKEWLVKYGPYIAMVLIVLALPVLLLVLGIGTALMPFGGVGYATGFGLVAIATLVQLGLTVAALPGLFARKMSAWTLLFYARLVGIVSALLAGALVAAVAGGAISLYILFQVRPLYKG